MQLRSRGLPARFQRFCRTLSLVLMTVVASRAAQGAPFTASWGLSSDNSGYHSLFIDGRQGVREYALQFYLDVPGPVFVNMYGQAVASGEATADPFLVYAVYPLGSDVGPPGGFADPGSLVTGRFGQLGWPPFSDQVYNIYPPSVVATGITDSGLASATVTYYGADLVTGEFRYDRREYSWQLRPIPEPGSYLLVLGALVFGAIVRGKMRCCRSLGTFAR
jgi:hypothetical protein